MNEEGRREISEWVTLLALLLALTLAPLPFVTEDRYFRVLPASLALIFPLIMLLGTMFPRGLRLPLGRWSLRIAPPAAYFVTYYSARRWLQEKRSRWGGIADRLDALKSEQDAMTAEIMRINAQIVDEIGVTNDDLAGLFVGGVLRSYTNYDAVLGAAIAAEIDTLREKLTQPPAATTGGVLGQAEDVVNAIGTAIELINTRGDASHAFAHDTLHQVKGMAIDSLTGLEQRSQTGAAKIAAIEAEVAELARQQPGRGRPKGSGYWTDDRLRALHAEYVNRGKTTSNDFAKDHGIDKSHMLKSFKRLGLPTEP